jgi:6-phosphofructokinase 1
MIKALGNARFPSPLNYSVDDQVRIPASIKVVPGEKHEAELMFEMAGPRSRLFFDPPATKAAIVTCGGLCPGMNNVIRSLFLELYFIYGVKEIIGFRYGYMGLDPANGIEPMVLTNSRVDSIHRDGGTILGTSRGPVNIEAAVDNLINQKVNILFTIGGDGTQKGGFELFKEAQKRNYPLAVVGIPKTIDNDVSFVSRTFGYLTAVEESCRVIGTAHVEAKSVQYGISLVKLMGRNAGFIAIGATVASQDVNFVLIPEVPFLLEGEKGFLRALRDRMIDRKHAVIVIAEGAGQDLLLSGETTSYDASGNVILKDIGVYMRERIVKHFKAEKIPAILRYFDPSYSIRSCAADAEDSILCDLYARNAVHAAMAGKTGLVIGYLHDTFIHVPIDLLTRKSRHVDLRGWEWRAAIAATGQPEVFG